MTTISQSNRLCVTSMGLPGGLSIVEARGEERRACGHEIANEAFALFHQAHFPRRIKDAGDGDTEIQRSLLVK